jgi:hypothetical protein
LKLGPTPRLDRRRANARNRRILPVPVGPGERRLTEPTMAVRRWQWDRRHDRRLLTYALASRLEGELDGSEGHEGGES